MRNYKATPAQRRKHRVRMGVRHQGKPRLSVFRSGRHIYAQVIDDSQHRTLASASSIEKGEKMAVSGCEVAKWVGKRIAEKSMEAGVSHIVFDRGEYRFHGQVKMLADGAREGGLVF